MSAFADSSAIVKLYVPEVGHEAIRSLRGPIVVSSLARVEVPAAFWGKSRTGELDASDAIVLVHAFEFDYHGDENNEPIFAIVSLNDEVLVEGARQAGRHGLRAYDAIQLGCAIAARQADPSIDTFAVFDVKLRAAAVAEGFSVVESS